MTEPYRPRKYVIGPDGSPLTIADLPAPGTMRWVIRRKAEVVKFRQLGFIEYNGALKVHSSLLSVILHDQPQIKCEEMLTSLAIPAAKAPLRQAIK